MKFSYRGLIPASKSILNRLLVVQSYFPELKILGNSTCDDVQAMRRALAHILNGSGEAADCAAAGTTFRFLALRAARNPGTHWLTGSKKLLARPQEELISLLRQVGVQTEMSGGGLKIVTEGWRKPAGPVIVDRTRSSQFASSVLLNVWNLDFDLEIHFTSGDSGEKAPSEGYLEMTMSLVKSLGMNWIETESGLRVPKHQRVRASEFRAESDLSSAFAVAALAAVGGRAVIENFPRPSLQPDGVFPEILASMGATVRYDANDLVIERGTFPLRAISFNLADCPDLFPVLAVLCALAEGKSKLYGAPHLVHKESDRISGVASLLQKIGCVFHQRPDGMEIEGLGVQTNRSAALKPFDPLEDHRLAMAAGVLQMAGFAIEVLHPEVVNKSFPEFWDVMQCR